MNFINLDKQYNRIKKDLLPNIEKVLSKCNFIMGEEVYELENKLQKYLDIRNAICCSSGSDALIISLMALDIGPGDYVITTPFSFIATADSISIVGATPVFVDIDPDTFNIDVNQVESKVEELGNKCKAIVCADIFGQQCDYKSLRYIANKYSIRIIQDAAQSFGSTFNNYHIGFYTDIATTSFFPTKPLGGYGDGGAMFTNSDSLAKKIRSIIQHGKGNSKYETVRLGINGRLDTIQAVVLIEKLKILDDEIKRRRHVATLYTNYLKDIVKTPVLNEECVWAQYSILSSKRDLIQEHLNYNGIPTNIYYPTPLHLQPIYKSDLKLPICENVCKNIISLPMCPYLEDDEIAYIRTLIKVLNEIDGVTYELQR
jgi:dTDP-4-amino-4,6-dideoxygalactose transaminase